MPVVNERTSVKCSSQNQHIMLNLQHLLIITPTASVPVLKYVSENVVQDM